MVKAFLDGLKEQGISYEIRSNDPKPDQITLSDGSRVSLEEKIIVSYTKRVKRKLFQYGYTITTARKIR